MSNKNNNKFEGYRGIMAGDPVFTTMTQQLDLDHDNKPRNLRIETPAVHAAIKTVIINEMKFKALEGGIEAIVINGGEKGNPVLSAGGSFIRSLSEVESGNSAKSWFADYDVVNSICKTVNDAEIIRLRAIKADIEKQIKALEDINLTNDAVAANYR